MPGLRAEQPRGSGIAAALVHGGTESPCEGGLSLGEDSGAGVQATSGQGARDSENAVGLDEGCPGQAAPGGGP